MSSKIKKINFPKKWEVYVYFMSFKKCFKRCFLKRKKSFLGWTSRSAPLYAKAIIHVDMTNIICVSNRGGKLPVYLRRPFSGQSLKIAFSTIFRPLKWRHQVAILNLCLITASLNFLLYHMQKTFFAYLYPKKSYKFFGST